VFQKHYLRSVRFVFVFDRIKQTSKFCQSAFNRGDVSSGSSLNSSGQSICISCPFEFIAYPPFRPPWQQGMKTILVQETTYQYQKLKIF